MTGSEDTSDILSALDGLAAPKPRWRADPSDRTRSGEKEWSLAIPELGLALRLWRRGRGETAREAGGVSRRLDPGYLASVSDASGNVVPIDGKYRQSLLGDVRLEDAKGRAVAMLVRQLTGMRDALSIDRAAPGALAAPERLVVDGVLGTMAKSGWYGAREPGWQRWFLDVARRQLEARAGEVVPLAERLVAAERNLAGSRKDFEESLGSWFGSGGHSRTKTIVVGAELRPVYVSERHSEDDEYPTRTYLGHRMEAITDVTRNRDCRPRPRGEEVDLDRAALEAARAALMAAVGPIADEARRVADAAHAAATALASIRAARGTLEAPKQEATASAPRPR